MTKREPYYPRVFRKALPEITLDDVEALMREVDGGFSAWAMPTRTREAILACALYELRETLVEEGAEYAEDGGF
jgi:hypothetical protein